MKRFVFVVMVVLVLASCGNGSDAVVVTGDDTGTEVAVNSGDEFEVRLESNPSTGFEWRIEPTGTASFLTLVSSDYVAPESDLVGAAGTEVRVFEVTQSGSGILRLEYVRLFDDPVIPERVVEFIVRADGVPWTRSTEPAPPTSTATAPTP